MEIFNSNLFTLYLDRALTDQPILVYASALQISRNGRATPVSSGTLENEEQREIATTTEIQLSREQLQYTSRLPPNEHDLLKAFDRFGQLLDTYFIDQYAHRFDVAFSFPGDIRDKVSRIAGKLCERLNKQKIFYDKYYKAELARPNLDLYLQTIYRYQTRLIVVFMCDDYALKEWCGLEARAIRSLLKSNQNHRIMLLSVDGKTIDGVLDIDGYLDISNESEEDVVNAIYSRFKDLDMPLQPSRSLHQLPLPSSAKNMISKMRVALKNTFQAISPWYIVVALISYMLGTLTGR
ncbi:unnamed protein product [Rotaria sp. Silwood2]|nr:unnamed protein product [Rotaria sp. Silwood2]CAF4571542.1 unnamed protein product [Rotaria sp. Silwood2]